MSRDNLDDYRGNMRRDNLFTQEWLDDYNRKRGIGPPLFTPAVVPWESPSEEIDEGPESELQDKIEAYCRQEQFYFFHDRSQRANRKGFPDLVIALKAGRTLWLELKSKGGVMSAEQKQVRLQLLALGHEHHVVKSFKRFKEIIVNPGFERLNPGEPDTELP